MVNKKTAFCKIPKVLYLSDRLYNSLSLGAVGVYCFMLERKSLSYSNSENWTDSKGEVFIHFSREDVEHFAKCKHDKASKIFRELESAVLIRRVHQGLGRPDRIYVYDLFSINAGYTVAQRESQCDTYGDDKTDDEKPILPMPVNPDLQTVGGGFSDTNNNEVINNDSKNTPSYRENDKRREKIKEQIGFHDLCKEYPKDQVNFLVGVIGDVVNSKNRNICIAGSTLDGDFVRDSFGALTWQEASYALHFFNTEKDTIRYPKAFLLTRIWEAKN